MIPPFTATEIAAIRIVLEENFQVDIEVQLADREVALDGDTARLTACPAVLWYHNHANFIVTKTDTSRYRGRFFYTPHEQFDTARNEYEDVGQCVSAILRRRSDHDRSDSGLNP